jgi:hypothetical protein
MHTASVNSWSQGLRSVRDVCPRPVVSGLSLCVLELSSFPASLTLVPLVLHRTYNPQDGRALKKAATQEQAMQELVEVVSEAYWAETSALLTVHPQRWPLGGGGHPRFSNPVHISPCALIPSYTCALLR